MHSEHFTPKQVIKIAICFKFYFNVIQLKNKLEVVDTDDKPTVSQGQVQGVKNEMNKKCRKAVSVIGFSTTGIGLLAALTILTTDNIVK